MLIRNYRVKIGSYNIKYIVIVYVSLWVETQFLNDRYQVDQSSPNSDDKVSIFHSKPVVQDYQTGKKNLINSQ